MAFGVAMDNVSVNCWDWSVMYVLIFRVSGNERLVEHG